jgi:hypothetical protein
VNLGVVFLTVGYLFLYCLTCLPQDSRTTTNKEKPIEGKLNRENLREKLTSTPVSNFDTDIAIKPRKVNASHVQLKETKPTDKLLKQSQKDSKEQKTTTERLLQI